MGSLLLMGCGGKGAAASSAAPLDGISGLTGAWSMSRNLLSSFASSRYSQTGGAVTAITDQSGNARNLNDGGNSARRPAETTAGPNSVLCADFDGTTDFLIFGSSAAASNFITTSAGYIVMSVIIDAYILNNAASYQNDVLIGDGGGIVGITARNTGGGTIYAHNWDGTEDRASAVVATATAVVLTWRHEGGSIYLTVNESETSAASGNSTTLANVLSVGDAFGGPANFKLFELAIFNGVPDAATRGSLITDFMGHVGAV